MPINILMPALSPTMEKGNLAKWLKKEGDKVKSGDVIAEIETDKATMEVEAVDEGTIAKILVPEGTQDVPVNDVIAVLAGDGEDVKSAGAGAARPAAEACRSAGAKTCRGVGYRAGSCCCPGSEAGGSVSAACRGSCAANQRPRPQLFFAAGAASGEGSRHRTWRHQRFRAAWPHHRARRRTGKIRQGAEGAGRGDLRPRPRLPRQCRTSRSSRCSNREATKSCRMTACGGPSRSA